MRTSIYVYTATKSIKPVTDYGAYIFAWTKDDGTPGTQARIFEVENRNAAMAEIALLAAAFKKLDSYGTPCEVTVYTENLRTVAAIESWLPKWKARDWIKSNGEPADELYKILDGYMARHSVHVSSEHGEYMSWLITNTSLAKEKREKACLINLETLTRSGR